MEENLERDQKTILVVDDEQPIIDILVYNLEKEGYNVIEANDGITAVDVALEKRPDLILLDIMLPKLDGLSVCKRIKNSLNVPILMLTAKDGEIDKILGLELGADDYITKPFSVRELVARVKANLRKVDASLNSKTIDDKQEKKKEVSKEKVGEEVVAKKTKTNDSQNKMLITLASVFVGLVVIITTIFVLIPKITSSKQAAVPDVTNYTVTEAIKALQDAGFVVSDEQREEANENVEEGRVSRTSPAIGSIRKEGTEVIIYRSLGDVKVAIEDYTGKNASEIKGKLEALKLQVIISKKDINSDEASDYKEGIIIEQSIAAGEKVSEGSSITLYVPKLDNKYPDFVADNYSVSEVEDFCDEYGVNLTKQEVETTEYAAGTIFYQSRAAGTTVVSGAKLTIKIAKEPSKNTENPDDGGLD